MGYQLTNN